MSMLDAFRGDDVLGQDGGAAFIMVYLLCILFLGVPGMVSEFIIGRHSASNAARAYKNLADGRPWQIIGYIGIFTSTVILGFYAVVAGWCLQYLLSSLMGQVNGDAEYITTFFREFSTDAVRPLVWTSCSCCSSSSSLPRHWSIPMP